MVEDIFHQNSLGFILQKLGFMIPFPDCVDRFQTQEIFVGLGCDFVRTGQGITNFGSDFVFRLCKEVGKDQQDKFVCRN
jgi:hypothetical protein